VPFADPYRRTISGGKMTATLVRRANGRFGALDGVRALAAYLVIGTHVGFNSGRTQVPGVLGPVLARLDIGVTLFFLLSGFLLYRPFALHSVGAAPAPRVTSFFWRRAVRIFPALWLFILVTLTFLTTYRVRASDYLHYLLLIQTYDHHDYDPNLTHLWTLAVEITFYALLPLFAWHFGRQASTLETAVRRQLGGCALMAITGLAFNILQGSSTLKFGQALLWLPAYLDWFALGMLFAILSALPGDMAVAVRSRRVLVEWANSLGTCWLVSGLLFMISTLPVGVPLTLAPATWWQWTAQHYLFGACAFFFMLPLILADGGVVARVLGSNLAHELAGISYSVYLWHVPIMLLLQRQLGFESFRGHFATMLPLTALVTTVIAALSWYCFEQPILRYATRSWRGAAEPAAAAISKPVTQSS
jgi:peptidoglycan/LPS O-acetylase OafA/YrhL